MARSRPRGKRHGKYKSGLERDFAVAATKKGLKFEYEPTKFSYSRPSHYIPDWKIGPETYIETKGWLAPFQRAGLLSFKEQHPEIRLLLLFGNSENRLNSSSKTTYAQWATKHGFECWDIRDGLPVHWWEKYADAKKKAPSK